jgi:predicted GNAT family acetyltransferase
MVTRVVHNQDAARYELEAEGEAVGFIDYELRGNDLHLVHTEIDPDKRKAGFGGALVRGTLDDVRGGSHRVVADCPFVASWIGHNPDYSDLLER